MRFITVPMIIYIELICVAVMTYLILYIAISYTYTDAIFYKSPATYIFSLIIWIIFYLLGKTNIRLDGMVNSIIRFIVETSYLVYLLQLNIGFTVMYYLREMGVNAYANIIGGVLATFLVAAVVHYLCENPVQNILRRLLKL